jgi:hypothetical protein
MSVSVIPEIQRIVQEVNEKALELRFASSNQDAMIGGLIEQIGDNYESLKSLYDTALQQINDLEKCADDASKVMIENGRIQLTGKINNLDAERSKFRTEVAKKLNKHFPVWNPTVVVSLPKSP